MIQSLHRVLLPHTLFFGGTFHLPLGFPPASATLLGALWQGLGRILRSTGSAPALPASGRAPCSQPRSRVPSPRTRGLAHAQTEAAGESAVPELHRGAVLAGVRESGRAQPQREVPALEAALFQLHAGLQRRPPEAQAPRSQPQHHVAVRPRPPRGTRHGSGAGGWREAGGESQRVTAWERWACEIPGEGSPGADAVSPP